MLNRYITFYKPAIQFVVFCAILSMSWLVGGYLIEMLNTKITGLSSSQINELKEIPAVLANQLKTVNALLLMAILFLPAAIFAYLAYPKPLQYLGVKLPAKLHHWLWGFTLILCALPFAGLLEQWSALIPSIGNSKELDDSYNKMATAMLQASTIKDVCLNILMMCIAPALIEEIFFRGCLQQILLNWMRKTPFTAILAVAVIFSAFHGQLSGFIPRVFLGLLLGLAYYFSGSIWVSILMHVINNLITVLMAYLYQAKITTIDYNHLPNMNIVLGLLSALAVVLLIYNFYKDRIGFTLVEVEKDDLIE